MLTCLRSLNTALWDQCSAQIPDEDVRRNEALPSHKNTFEILDRYSIP